VLIPVIETMNYYKRHIGDYAAATRHLSILEHGVYCLLLDMYYTTEGPLPASAKEVCRKLGVRSKDETAAVESVLRDFFTPTDDGWRQARCDAEIAAYKAKEDKNKANGTRGGRPKKITQSVSDGNPKITQSVSGNQKSGTLTTNQEPKNTKVETNVPPSGETDELFAYWQRAMAHPQAKLDAKRERNIKARLKDCYTVEQLCKAVDGCKLSPHHMGQNDTRTVYDDIELICRDGPRVDKFIALVERGGGMAMSPGLRQQVDVLQTWLEKQED